MEVATGDKTIVGLTSIYFLVAIVLVISEIKYIEPLIYVLRPFRVFILMALYFFSSKIRSTIYFAALLLGLVALVCFMGSSDESLMYGSIAFIGYRLITIIIVWRTIKTINFSPLMIATFPFLFVTSYLIILLGENAGMNFYPFVINGMLLSLMGGLSLYRYVLDDNKNPWLIISSLLFVAQFFVFVIQKYYLFNAVFQPITAIIFSICHYTYYRFVLMDEKFEALAKEN